MLIKCTGCGNMVSDKAVGCPKCGKPVSQIISENSNVAAGENHAASEENVEGDEGMQMFFAILSYLCYIFAILDIVLFYVCDIDLTGVYWTPIAASALGYVFSAIGNRV